MDPTGNDFDEQSEQERLDVARRYRELRSRRLTEPVEALLGHEVVAVGEFSSLPRASYAAIPMFGALIAAAARLRARVRSALPEQMLLALDSEAVRLIATSRERLIGGIPLSGPPSDRADHGLNLVRSWPRDSTRIASVTEKFLATEVVFLVDQAEIRLYTASLKSNPWSAELVRRLGGDAPAPRDLGQPGDGSGP